MRALRIAIPTVYLLASCEGATTQRIPKAGPALETTSAAQAGLPSDYSLTDTTRWGNTLGEAGQRAVLRRRGVVIDTVDIGFGILFGGTDSLVFLPVRTDTLPGSAEFHESSRTEHVLWTPPLRHQLKDILPWFDPYFSSPRIDEKSIIYWGTAPADSGKVALYAMRYDFRAARLDSLFLKREDGVGGTDARDYYGVPQIRGTQISFHDILVDRTTWRVIKQDTPPQ